MSYDLNDAQPQMAPIGELIPDGTFAKVRLTVRPGGVDGATPMDAKLLKASQSSDAKMLDCECTILEGPHARRKFWQSFTVAGGKPDEKGQSIGWKISKSTFRAMVDSALGLDPRDESPDAKAKRVLPGLKHLNGIVFAARIMVEPASNPQYRDQNRIANVVLPDEPQHTPFMRGEAVHRSPSTPRRARPRARRRRAGRRPRRHGARNRKPRRRRRPGARRRRPRSPRSSRQPSNRLRPRPTRRAGAPATSMPAWLNG